MNHKSHYYYHGALMPPQSVRCIVNRVYTERSKVYSVQCLVQLLTDILTDTANASHVGSRV